jgi:hypothetical protein
MTQYPATRTTPPKPSSGGIDLKTLWITAASSAAAAYACSKIWTAGTLAAAAFTPVLVAIIREALSKSTEVVTRAVPVRGVVRGVRQPLDPAHPPSADATFTLAGGDPMVPPHADDPAFAPVADDPALGRVAQAGEISYHGSGGRGRGWRVAIVTGLLGFVIAAVVFTVPELVSGSSAAGGGRDTTLFGGKQHHSATPPVTTTPTTTTPAETQTVTVPPVNTVTVPPAQTITTPSATTPAPTQQQAPAATVPPATTPAQPPVPEPPPVAEPAPG